METVLLQPRCHQDSHGYAKYLTSLYLLSNISRRLSEMVAAPFPSIVLAMPRPTTVPFLDGLIHFRPKVGAEKVRARPLGRQADSDTRRTR